MQRYTLFPIPHSLFIYFIFSFFYFAYFPPLAHRRQSPSSALAPPIMPPPAPSKTKNSPSRPRAKQPLRSAPSTPQAPPSHPPNGSQSAPKRTPISPQSAPKRTPISLQTDPKPSPGCSHTASRPATPTTAPSASQASFPAAPTAIWTLAGTARLALPGSPFCSCQNVPQKTHFFQTEFSVKFNISIMTRYPLKTL